MKIFPEALSIFDLDKTLAKKNTSFAFGIWCYKKKKLSLFSALSMCLDYGLHRLNLISFYTVHKRAKKRFQKIHSTQESLTQDAENFVNEEWNKLLHAPINKCLQRACENNHFILLLSAGPSFLIQEIVKKLPHLIWHATEWNHSGEICVVDGQRKLELAKVYASKLNMPREKITVYTDSIHDLPLLKFAGNPMITQPDRKLKRLSQLNRWTILYNP